MSIIPLVMSTSQLSPGDKWRLSIDTGRMDPPAVAPEPGCPAGDAIVILERFVDDPVDSAGNHLPGPAWSYIGDVTAVLDEVGVAYDYRAYPPVVAYAIDDRKALVVLHREMTQRGAAPMQPSPLQRYRWTQCGPCSRNDHTVTESPDRVRWTDMAGQLLALVNMLEEGRVAPFSTLDVTIERGNGPGQEHVEIGRKWKLEATTLSRPPARPEPAPDLRVIGERDPVGFARPIPEEHIRPPTPSMKTWVNTYQSTPVPPDRPIDRRTAVAIARAAAAKHNVSTTSSADAKWPPEWVMTAIIEASK